MGGRGGIKGESAIFTFCSAFFFESFPYQGDVDMMIYYGGMFYFVTYNPEALQTLIVSMTISASHYVYSYKEWE